MKFTDYKYEHMDIEALQAQLKGICSKLQNAASYDDFKNAFIELNDVNKYINTNQTLVEVRHTVDTRDEYYTKENDFLNEMLPVLKEDIVNCNKAVMESSFVSELKKEVPETYFLQREPKWHREQTQRQSKLSQTPRVSSKCLPREAPQTVRRRFCQQCSFCEHMFRHLFSFSLSPCASHGQAHFRSRFERLQFCEPCFLHCANGA